MAPYLHLEFEGRERGNLKAELTTRPLSVENCAPSETICCFFRALLSISWCFVVLVVAGTSTRGLVSGSHYCDTWTELYYQQLCVWFAVREDVFETKAWLTPTKKFLSFDWRSQWRDPPRRQFPGHVGGCVYGEDSARTGCDWEADVCSDDWAQQVSPSSLLFHQRLQMC